MVWRQGFANNKILHITKSMLADQVSDIVLIVRTASFALMEWY
jgi:hypothetical protein